MRRRQGWRGAALYLGILGASMVAFVLRTHTLPAEGSAEPAPTAANSSVRPTQPGGGATSGRRASRSPARSSTINGDAVRTPFGIVQVKVTFRGSDIVDVSPLQTPNRDRRSVGIADRAVPLLHDEVIKSQSAQVDTVSGATYTSAGYLQSVQSAIDQH